MSQAPRPLTLTKESEAHVQRPNLPCVGPCLLTCSSKNGVGQLRDSCYVNVHLFTNIKAWVVLRHSYAYSHDKLAIMDSH